MVYHNEEKYIKALNENWKAIKKMPEVITHYMAWTAIQKNWRSILYISDFVLDQNLCNIAFGQSWKAIKGMPDEFITLKMCDIAFKQDWKSIQWIPKRMRTEEMCVTALKQDCGFAIKWVPHTIRHSASFYSSLIASDFSIPYHENIPAVFYENCIKAIWAKYDEPRAMLEMLRIFKGASIKRDVEVEEVYSRVDSEEDSGEDSEDDSSDE
jgi:hypothetical protein